MGLMGEVRVGCSGWQYKHWRGNFYPADIPVSRWFDRYAEIFDTVESCAWVSMPMTTSQAIERAFPIEKVYGSTATTGGGRDRSGPSPPTGPPVSARPRQA